jgi:hypothetical protein
MKTYKSSIYLLLGAVLLTGALSCKKELNEVAPQDALSTSTVLTDPNAAQTLYTGVYTSLRQLNGNLFLMGEMRSDLWTDGIFAQSADPTCVQLYDQNISALNVPLTNWGSFYSLLFQINNVIALFPGGPLPVAERNEELAEMYGLRAYVYYNMMQTWGAVPLITKPITSVGSITQLYTPRTSADSILLQIRSDIQQSLNLFNGVSTFASNRVNWNNVATLVLKGDVNIWAANLMNGGAAALDTALAALQQVESMQGSSLELNANYANIFNPSDKTNNPEIIFALDYELNQLQMTGTTDYFESDLTVNAIEATILTFRQGSDTTISQLYPYVNGGQRVGLNQTMINNLTSGPADQRITGSINIMYNNSAPYGVAGTFLNKYAGQVIAGAQVYNTNYPIYRYAEVLLLAAEAKANLGLDPSPEINQIRLRAYGSGYTPYVNGSLSGNIAAILNEELREFIGEGKRWYELRREGQVYNYINPVYLSAATAASGVGPTLLLPISITMLDGDPTLVQTAGY